MSGFFLSTLESLTASAGSFVAGHAGAPSLVPGGTLVLDGLSRDRSASVHWSL